MDLMKKTVVGCTVDKFFTNMMSRLPLLKFLTKEDRSFVSKKTELLMTFEEKNYSVGVAKIVQRRSQK